MVRTHRLMWALLLCVVLAPLATHYTALGATAQGSSGILDASLRQAFAASADGTITFIVRLQEQADLSDIPATPVVARRTATVDRLQQHAARTQAPVIELALSLQRQGAVIAYTPYWIFSGLAVQGSIAAAQELASHPAVASVHANQVVVLNPSPAESAQPATTTVPWGLEKIRAPQVWGDFGVRGEGVVVANIDTGVDWTHPALYENYRGYDPIAPQHDYQWIDLTPTAAPAQAPDDFHGHGTHTMGTMVGADPETGNIVGVAPSARWIAVKAFYWNGLDWISDEATLHSALQWCLAPTDRSGENPDPSLAPDIINNSWGDADGTLDAYLDDVRALNAAGILAVYSAGNRGAPPPGSTTGTINAPASYPEALAVGATTSSDDIASFSSRGPSPFDSSLKPDVSAPGNAVYSALPGSRYGYLNGTSMAAPHVAGLAALLWSADRSYHADLLSGAMHGAPERNPTLTVTSTKQLIRDTSVDLGDLGPDTGYGWGRVDALAAMRELVGTSTLLGHVSCATTGQPLTSTHVTLQATAHDIVATTLTDAAGEFALVAPPETYTLTVAHPGYLTTTLTSLSLQRDLTTTVTLTLDLLPHGALQGVVTHGGSAEPVTGALVRLAGTPYTATTSANGSYALSAPPATYTAVALPPRAGWRGAQVDDVAIASGVTTTLDITLPTAPRVLLVHGDAWADDSAALYYGSTFDAALWGYDQISIATLPDDIPDATALAAYDAVVWSHPSWAPSTLDAWKTLETYLASGGRLLLSGQNVAPLDGGDPIGPLARLFHAHGGPSVTGTGLLGDTPSPLQGLSATLNHPESAANQMTVVGLLPTDGWAQPLAHIGSDIVAIGCRLPGAASVLLSFGLEGIGPAEARAELLADLLDWLLAPTASHRVHITLIAKSVMPR